jgi:hypothetical protein
MRLAISAFLLFLNIFYWINADNSMVSHACAFSAGLALCATLYFLHKRIDDTFNGRR